MSSLIQECCVLFHLVCFSVRFPLKLLNLLSTGVKQLVKTSCPFALIASKLKNTHWFCLWTFLSAGYLCLAGGAVACQLRPSCGAVFRAAWVRPTMCTQHDVQTLPQDAEDSSIQICAFFSHSILGDLKRNCLTSGITLQVKCWQTSTLCLLLYWWIPQLVQHTRECSG